MADLSTMAALQPVLLLSEQYGSNSSPDLATRGQEDLVRSLAESYDDIGDHMQVFNASSNCQ